MTQADPRPATPGTMTAAMRAVSHVPSQSGPQDKSATTTHLKLALGRGDRLAETRRVAPGGGATIGRGLRSTFVLGRQAYGGPSAILVELADDGSTARWTLPAGAKARWKHGARSGEHSGGEHFVVPAEARVVVWFADGCTRIMAEAVEVATHAEPRGVVPVQGDAALLRRGLFGHEIDWLLTLCVALSTTLVYGFALYADQMDFVAPPPGLAALPPVQLTYDAPMAPPEPPLPRPTPQSQQDETAPTAHRQRSPVRTTRHADGSRTHHNPSRPGEGRSAVRLAEAQREAEQSVATVLGAIGGSFDRVMDAPTFSETEHLLEDARAQPGSTSDGAIAARTAPASPNRQGLEGLRQSEHGGMAVEEGPPARERPVHVIPGRIWTDPARDFDARVVLQAIRRRVSGVRRCYDRVLLRDPNISGRITIRFAVDSHGRFVRTNVASNGTGSQQLANCVAGIIGRTRASRGPDGSPVPFTYPFIFRLGG